jgi:hypothetical protein
MGASAGPDLDPLYREHPDGFVAARNAIAKDLRAAGDREAADRVAKLRRPSAAAWLLNRVALTAPDLLDAFAKAASKLEEAQRRALEGEDEGAAGWRAAAARERDAVRAVVDAAESGAKDAGHPPTARAADLVDETLRAASADPELRERVVGGRVEREQSVATIGTLGVSPPPRRGRARKDADPKKRDAAQARRELKRLERQLADAEAREERLRARVDDAAEALRREQAELAEAKRETAALRRQAKAAERRSSAADA